MNAKTEAPIEYPREPNILLEQYPGLYHRSYVGGDQPILPAASMDVHTLDVLKSTIGCRSTRKTNGPLVTHMPRHLG